EIDMSRKKGAAVLLSTLLAISASAAEPPPPPPVLNPRPGDAVSVREGDAWSGATVEKKEGHKYSIRYSDGTEEWVTIDRMRPAAPSAAGDNASATATADGGAAV